MEQILHDENPSMFLFGLPSVYGVNKTVSGFGPASDKCRAAGHGKGRVVTGLR